jgi:hypothetical protein
MKCFAVRCIVAAIVACALARAAGAQTPQTPQPPEISQIQLPEGVPITPTAETETAPVVRPWIFSVGVSESYESDVLYTGTGNGDWGTVVGGHLSRGWALHRGSIGLSGDASQILYRRATDLNQFTYGLGLGMSYALTHRLSWRAAESLTTGFAQSSRIATDAALLAPRTVSRTNVAATGVVYQLSSRTDLHADVSQTNVLFQDSPLSAGSSLTVRVALTRQLAPNQTVGVSGGTTISSGATGDIQGLMGTWQGTFGRSLTLNASGGVRPYTLEGVSGYRFAPGGLFAVNGRFARAQSLGASYEYAVEQAYGYGGTHLAHRFNGNYRATLIGGLSGEVGASYGLNSYPERPGYNLDGRTATIAMGYLITHQLSLRADYGLWVRHETGAPSVSTYRTTFGLTYGRSFR